MPDSLNENPNWLAVPHEQIWRDINTGPGAKAAVPMGDVYAKASQAVADAQQNLRDGLTRLTAGWQGSAATEATAAISRLHDWADTAQQGLEAARAASAQQVQHYSDARSKIPAPAKAAPPIPGNGPGLAIASNVDQDPLEKAGNDAHRRAAEAMATYQAQSSRTISSLPVYSSAPDVAILVGGTTFMAAGTTSYRQSVAGAPHGSRQQDTAGSATIPGQQTGPVPVSHHASSATGLSGATMSPTSSLAPTASTPTAAGPQSGAALGTAGGGIIGGVLGGGGSARRSRSSARKSTGDGIMQPASGGRGREEDKEHDNQFVLGDDMFAVDDMVAPTVIGAEEDGE